MSDTPRVFVECLGCRSNGFPLTGEWFEGETAPQDMEEFNDVFQVRNGLIRSHVVHEELRCTDYENYAGLIKGECSPAVAQKVAELIEELGDDVDAYAAWRVTGLSSDEIGEDLSEFRDAFLGRHGSEKDFAQEYAEGTGELAKVPEDFRAHIDWDSYTRDLFMDLASEPAPGGGVFVFSTH